MRTAIIAGILAVAAASGAAFAQTAPAPSGASAPAATTSTKPDDGNRAKFRQACGADLAKFCGDAKPAANATPEQMKEARAKTRACLATHQAELSVGCKSVLDERAAKKS